MERKRIAVVGAGYAGLVSIAQLKNEGLEPVCFERSDTLGGMWCYRKESKYGQASVMPTTIINHSKEMGAFSNFPPRGEFSNYMKHSQLLEYFKEYAENNDCPRYIKFNTEVLRVKRADDYEKSGRWSITWKDLNTGKVATEIFDGVLICTGHNNMPIMPKFPGQDKFTGKILHTHTLKEVEEFSGQNVVVVGMGCSALDAAVEISRVAKQVYLSTRSGAFVISRVGRNGYPIDYLLGRRYLTWTLDVLPTDLISWYVETFYIDNLFDHRLYFVEPKHHILSKDPNMSDHIGSKLLSGTIIQRGDIDHFTENGIVLDGGETITEVDSVVMATGYTWGFPILEDGVTLKENDGRINLYKCMYPVDLPHPTLAFIGFFNPYGPGYPLGELQARWAAFLLATNGKLPSKETIMEDVIKRHEMNTKRYCPSEKMTIRVDFVQYMDEIAVQLGVKPNLLKYMLTDFPLFMRLLFGPCLSYQYRLEGHGKWEGARDAIMTCEKRMQFHLRMKEPYKRGIIQTVAEVISNALPYNFHVFNY